MSKFCSNCGNEVIENADVCLKCGKSLNSNTQVYKESEKKKFSFGRVIIGVIIGLIFIIYISPNIFKNYNTYSNSSSNNKKDYITLNEFNKIENGMTYEEVANIIGSEGTVMSESNILDNHTIIYYWYGKNGVANANFTFSNDKLINKTQIGLN